MLMSCLLKLLQTKIRQKIFGEMNARKSTARDKLLGSLGYCCLLSRHVPQMDEQKAASIGEVLEAW